jgi:hypothetical protein
VVDLVDAKSVKKVRAPVGKRIKAGAQDHVLAEPFAGRPLHDLLGHPGSHTDPAAECEQRLAWCIYLQALHEAGTLLAGQRKREWVIEHRGRRLFEMKCPGDGRQHRCPAGTPEGGHCSSRNGRLAWDTLGLKH